jgi:hypothetical protein
MAKFESSVVVRRKLQVEFGKNIPGEDSITSTFQCFFETGAAENRGRSRRRFFSKVMLSMEKNILSMLQTFFIPEVKATQDSLHNISTE